MKLRSKINLYTTVMFICLLILIDVAIYLSFSRMLLNSDMERSVAVTVGTISGMKDLGMIGEKDLLRAKKPLNGMIQIVKSDGNTGPGVAAPGYDELRNLP